MPIHLQNTDEWCMPRAVLCLVPGLLGFALLLWTWQGVWQRGNNLVLGPALLSAMPRSSGAKRSSIRSLVLSICAHGLIAKRTTFDVPPTQFPLTEPVVEVEAEPTIVT